MPLASYFNLLVLLFIYISKQSNMLAIENMLSIFVSYDYKMRCDA